MTARKSNRRTFLLGGSAVDAVQDTVAGWVDDIADAPEARYLLRMSRRAMACDFELFFTAGQYEQATERGLAAFDLIEAIEAQLTVYRATSEVSQLNARAATEAVAVEFNLFELIARALAITAATDGAYDVTSGPLTRAWGFDRRSGAVPSDEALSRARSATGSQYLEIDAARSTVAFRRAGMELNFGGIGKGYALDCAADVLTAGGVDDFLWHGGRSSVLARGAAAGSSAAAGWTVGIGHPLGTGRRWAEVRLCNRALATSGASFQFFRHAGRRYGHLLDPRTGWPAEGVFSSTVIASTAADADALSTAFYVGGPDLAARYCAAHADVGALLLCPSATGSAVELLTFGLDDDDWRLVDEA